MVGIKQAFSNRSYVSILVFILIILYAIASINILFLALGVLPYLPEGYFSPYLWIWFALASFGITALVCVYHLVNMLRRRKRKTDKINQQEGKQA